MDIYNKKSEIESARPKSIIITHNKSEYLYLYSFKVGAVATDRELINMLDSSAKAALVSLD